MFEGKPRGLPWNGTPERYFFGQVAALLVNIKLYYKHS
jgi:hypothetical protein